LISVLEEVSGNLKTIFDFQNSLSYAYLSGIELSLGILLSLIFLYLPINETWWAFLKHWGYNNAIMTYISIYIIYLLSLLSLIYAIKVGYLCDKRVKELKEKDVSFDYIDLINIANINKISINIFYLFIPGGIIIASIPFAGKSYTLFEFGSPAYYVVSLIIIFAFILIPIYKLSSVIKIVKYDYINNKLLLVDGIETALMKNGIEKQEYYRYELATKFIEKARRVSSWPFDFDGIIKISITILVAILPSLLSFYRA
jgi:hypothetical protein